MFAMVLTCISFNIVNIRLSIKKTHKDDVKLILHKVTKK